MTDLIPADSIDPMVGRRRHPTDHIYAATYPGAPERTTRAQAERDMCRHRQEQTR